MVIIVNEPMDKKMLIEYCSSLENAIVDRPFKYDFLTVIARHRDTKKWFGAIMEREGRVFINVKCDPLDGDFLQYAYKGITPGYHMNKTHWISVYLNSDIPDELILQLVYDSYKLTERGKGKINGKGLQI